MMTADSAYIDTEDRLLERDVYHNTLTNPKKIPISTKYGYVLVTQQGPVNRTAIITYHDMGHNSASQFHYFFAMQEMISVTEHFTIYNINAPGQEEQANPLPPATIYPTLDELAETVNDVFTQLNIKSAIGFGIGIGANILTRFALKHPSKIYGLILVNCVSRGPKWLEGFSLKWPTKDVPQQRWTESLMNYLIWYHLGSDTQATQPDLVNMYRRHLEEDINVKNVIKLLNVYLKRTPIPLDRPGTSNKAGHTSKTLQCSVLNITGSSSPHKKDVIDTNDRFDSSQTSYVELADCGGAIIDEQPAKLAESIRLFLQGLGYMSHLSIPRYSTANRLAEQVADYKRQHGSFSKVPRQLSTQVSCKSHDIDDEVQLRVDTLDNTKIMSFHQRDEIRWNKKGYFERFDGKKYWRKLCVIEGCMKRAKVLNWCKRHYTEQKQKSLISTPTSTLPTQVPQLSLTNSIPTSINSNSILSSNLLLHTSPHYHHLQAVSQIPMPTPSYLYTSPSTLSEQSQSIYHVRNEIRLNKRGYREQYDGIGHWRPLCIYEQCPKRAKKLSYCKRHYTEQMNKTSSTSSNSNSLNLNKTNHHD